MEELNKTINSEEAEKVEAQENLHNEGIVDDHVGHGNGFHMGVPP